MGYYRAGFHVVGVDIRPQPRYPFLDRFVQADAMNPPFDLRMFDVIHASPPCQAYSRATAWRGDRGKHPDLIDQTRRLLEASGRPYVIENVQDARHRLISPMMLCGSVFGLKIRRHRYFESPALPFSLGMCCQHRTVDMSHDHGKKQTEKEYTLALGCEWMTVHEARQAIPPAYTEFMGHQLIQILETEVGE